MARGVLLEAALQEAEELLLPRRRQLLSAGLLRHGGRAVCLESTGLDPTRDLLIVLLHSEDEAVPTEEAIVEIADRLSIPLSGTWRRLDERTEGEAGIAHENGRLSIKPADPVSG